MDDVGIEVGDDVGLDDGGVEVFVDKVGVDIVGVKVVGNEGQYTFGVEVVRNKFGLDSVAVDLVGLDVDGLEVEGDVYPEDDKAFVFAVVCSACKAPQSAYSH